jgi:hypothetical protein
MYVHILVSGARLLTSCLMKCAFLKLLLTDASAQ